jgi:hypothetical protein
MDDRRNRRPRGKPEHAEEHPVIGVRNAVQPFDNDLAITGKYPNEGVLQLVDTLCVEAQASRHVGGDVLCNPAVFADKRRLHVAYTGGRSR